MSDRAKSAADRLAYALQSFTFTAGELAGQEERVRALEELADHVEGFPEVREFLDADK